MDDPNIDHLVKRAEGRVGSTLKDKWRIDKLLGVGGMAVVYAATHRNGKRVAVKMLHAEMSVDPTIRERFLREGYVANRVGHRGAVTVDDDDVADDGAAFLVMELLEGETLDARMRRKGGSLPPDEVLSLADQVLDTLTAAHANDIVHRDLKPENIFLTREGVVKILDFGIARIRELSSKSATQTGSLMGTPAFMAPEQARGRWEDVDARTDLWAVGATLFMLLTGRFVHEAETVNEALVMAVTSRARPLASLASEIPGPVAALVDKALAYEQDGRFQSAQEMQAAVRRAYAAIEGSEAMQDLSVPNDGSEGVTASASPSKPATLTTGRGVSSTVGASSALSPPETVHKKRKSLALALATGVAALVVIGIVVAQTHERPSAPSAREPASPTAAPPERATAAAGPIVTPVAGASASEGTQAVSVDSLPLEKKAVEDRSSQVQKARTLASADGTHAAQQPPKPVTPSSPKAEPAVPTSPIATSTSKKADPFSKRF
jgi:eukaryotic-like serine/threonine-protein kinase